MKTQYEKKGVENWVKMSRLIVMRSLKALLYLSLIFQVQLLTAATVIDVGGTPTSTTAATHTNKYQIVTADVGGWPGWYIDSISISNIVAFTSSYNPVADSSKFNMRIYDSTGVQLSQYSASSVSALGARNAYGDYPFTVTFNLPSQSLFFPGSTPFFFSVERTDPIGTPGPLLNAYTFEGSTSYPNGWGFGMGYAGNVGTGGLLWYNVPAVKVDATMVPEPSALSLLSVGLGGWAMMRRRRS